MGEKRRITIKDVARHAGVSPGAVSRVLHGKTSTIRVSEITADLIRRAAIELDYRPNPVAQSLRSGRTNIIALASQRDFVCGGEDSVLIHRLILEASSVGYSVLLNANFFGKEVMTSSLRGNFDSVIWLGSPDEQVTDELISSIRVPLGCINSNPSLWPGRTLHWNLPPSSPDVCDVIRAMTVQKVEDAPVSVA
jgi:LacI family transcriptional regulator